MNKEKTSIPYILLLLTIAFFAIAPAANAAYGNGYNTHINSGNDNHNSYNNDRGGHYTPPPPTPAPHHDYDNHVQYHPVQTPVYTYPTQSYSYPVYYPVAQPVYYQQPYYQQPTVYYQQPTTYYQQPTTYYQQPTTYYQPAQTYAYNNQYNVPQYTVPNQNNAGLTVSCSADTSTATVNQPVSWTAAVSGGIAPYTYSWSGSGGLSGSQSSIVKYYDASDLENALVTVTSANGLTGTQACNNAVTVQNPVTAYVPQEQVAPTPQASESNVSLNAAAVGLSGVVFGWIAAIIILILLGTIMYIVVSRRG
jgi:hypothetical protein